MDGDSKRVLLIIRVAIVLIAVIVFAMGSYYFIKTRSVSVAPESEAQTIGKTLL